MQVCVYAWVLPGRIGTQQKDDEYDGDAVENGSARCALTRENTHPLIRRGEREKLRQTQSDASVSSEL